MVLKDCVFKFCDYKENCIFYFIVLLDIFDEIFVDVIKKFVEDVMVIYLKNIEGVIFLMFVVE